MYLCMYVRTYVCVYISMYALMYLCMYVCMRKKSDAMLSGIDKDTKKETSLILPERWHVWTR
jgi:hypothetical protein